MTGAELHGIIPSNKLEGTNMSLIKLIEEVEKLTFQAKPTVLSKLISVAGILAQHPEAEHLLDEPKPAKPAKPSKPAFTKSVKPGSDMPVGG